MKETKTSIKRLIKKIIIIILIISPVLFGIYIKLLVFPFITVKYIDSIEKFNATPDKNWKINGINLRIPISEHFKRQIKQKYPLLFQENTKLETIKKLIFIVREKLHQCANIVNDLDKIINSKKEYCAICSGYSKFLCAISQVYNIPSRIVWLNGHTVSEIYFNNYGWVLVDSNLNVVYKTETGKFASLLEVITNFNKLKAIKIDLKNNVNDPEFNYNNLKKVMPDNNLIVVLEGTKILSFEKIMRTPKKIISYCLGNDLVKGIQYSKTTNLVGNNRLSIQLFFIIYLALFIILIII